MGRWMVSVLEDTYMDDGCMFVAVTDGRCPVCLIASNLCISYLYLFCLFFFMSPYNILVLPVAIRDFIYLRKKKAEGISSDT